jgi:hypothetical protein
VEENLNVIHLTSETKDQTFQLHEGWKLIFNGKVPSATWQSRGGAETQLALLRNGYSEILDDGTIKHIKAHDAQLIV